MIVNTEFGERQNGDFRHFWIILSQRSNGQKYASFEGVKMAVTPLFYRHLGTKKALTGSAFFEYSRVEKRRKLVQNVKNQFFHQLASRGIGVIQTLTFSVNLPYL